MTRATIAALVCSFAFAWNAPVSAQEIPPDLVRTRDGSLVRGTIVELIANDHVTIVTVTGETRTFPAADVVFAGRAVDEPPAAPAPAPSTSPPSFATPDPSVPPPPVTQLPEPGGLAAPVRRGVRFVSGDSQPITVHVQAGQAFGAVGGYGYVAVAFRQLCTTPCTAELEPGAHRLAVDFGRGGLRGVRGQVTIEDGATYRVSRQSRRVGRAVFWSILAASAIIGAGMMVHASNHMDDDDYGILLANPVGGVGFGLVMAPLCLVSVGAMSLKDRGRVERVDDQAPAGAI